MRESETLNGGRGMELNIVVELAAQIENTKSKLQQIDDSLKRLTRTNDGLPKSKTEDRLGALISLKIDLASELTSLELKLDEEKTKLFNRLMSVEMTAAAREVLIRRYVELQQFKNIAAEMKYSEGSIYRLHRQGKRYFQRK